MQEDIIQNPHKVSTALLAEYRTSASKYSHAVSYINNFQESEHTLQARWRAHSVVAGIALSRLQSLLLHAFEEEMVAFSSALDSSRFNSLRSNLAKLYAHTAGLSALRDFMGQNLDELLPVLSKYVAYLTTILESDGTDCAGQQQQSPPQPPIHSTRRKEQVAQHNLQKAAPDNSNGDDQSDMDIRMDSMHCADLQHWRDLPEVLKLSAELSYELLGLLPPPPPPSISTPTADTVYTLSDTSQHIGSAAVGAAMASTEGIDLFSVDLKKRGTRKQATLFPNNVKEMRQDLRSHIQICLDILLRVVHPSQQSIVNIMLSEFAQSQLW